MSLVHLYMAVSIVAEVIATTMLKASDGFTRLLPGAAAVIGYGFAFYFMSLTLRSVPTGVVYAIWSGAGIVLVSIISLIIYKQVLDLPAIIGIVLILVGVLIINLCSQNVAH
ncbi:MAG: SMR family transporter [Acetobacteraceae bacterium]